MRFNKPMTRLNSFREYGIKLGLDLLKDDLLFINKMLDEIDSGEYKPLLKRYCVIWLSTIEKEENSSLKQNLGRRTANLWLREEVNLLNRKIK